MHRLNLNVQGLISILFLIPLLNYYDVCCIIPQRTNVVLLSASAFQTDNDDKGDLPACVEDLNDNI